MAGEKVQDGTKEEKKTEGQSKDGIETPKSQEGDEEEIQVRIPDDVKEILKKAKEDARLEERQKLGGQLKSAEELSQEKLKENKTLQEKLELLERQVQERETALAEFQKQAEADEGSKKKVSEDEMNAVIESKAEALLKQVEAAMVEKDKVAQTQIEQLQEQLRQKELKEYRDALIAKANGQIIPELVAGNSVEELDASFLVARERYQGIAESLAGNVGNQLAGSGAGAPPAAGPGIEAAGSAPPGTSQESQLVRKVAQMTNEEFNANRDALKAELEHLFPRGLPGAPLT